MFQVTTTFQYVSVQRQHPTISYFTRFSPNPKSFLTSHLKNSKITIETKLTHGTEMNSETENTLFDHAYMQYFEHNTNFGFDGSPDSIYRFAQGALMTSTFDHTVSSLTWLNFKLVGENFPEGGDKIRGLIFVVKDKPGHIIEEYGTPVMAIIEDEPTQNKVDPSIPRLMGSLETEEDFYHAMIYWKEQGHSKLQKVTKSVEKLEFHQYSFHQILSPNNDEYETNLRAVSAWIDELNLVVTLYDQIDHIPTYGLGKMLMPGQGLTSYILQAAGADGAEQLDRKVYAVSDGTRAAVICMGVPNLGKYTLLTILRGAFREHGILEFTHIFEMVATSDSASTGDIIN